MRKLYKPFCFIAAVAAMSLTSCQKESFAPGSEEGTVITVHATVEDVANATKTHIDGTQVYWDQEEQMRIVSFDEANAASNSLSEGFTPSADYTTATFTVNINTEGKTMIAGVYPASAAVDDNKNANKYKMILPASQQATADSYDPAAYVMITKAESLPLQNNEWNASYIRAAALTRMEVAGLNDSISSVTITFPESQSAAGRRYFDLASGVAGEIYTDKSNEITVSYAEPLLSDNSQNVWFTSWNVDVAQGETVTVKIESDTKIYTKTFTANKAISLKENFLNIMPIDMTGATEEELSPAEDYSGEYLIITKYKEEDWYYMTNQNTDNKDFEQGTTTISSSRDFNTLSKDDFSSIENIENNLWKISKFNDGYSVYNAASQQYLTLGGSNRTAGVSTEETALYITKQEDGTFQISNMEGGQWYLQYNYNADYFANYKGTQQDIYLLPWVESTNPMLIVSQPEQTVAADAESVSFTYVARNISGDIAAVKGTDADNIIRALSVDETSSTVNVSLNPNTDEVEKIATITLSAEGVNSVTLTITQEAAVVEVTPVKATIAEFLAAEVNTTDWYELTGTIVSISNTTYGSLTIEDETGTVYIYGLTDTKQNSNDKSFSSLGLAAGDILTLATLRGEYGGEAQGGGDIPAYYISHEPAPVPEGTEIINMSDFFSGKENLENGKAYIWGSLSVTFEKHNNSISNYDGEVIRLYQSDKLTFDAGEKTIVRMEFEATQGTWSADTGTISGYNWEGESSIVTLTATKQVRFSKITVTYKQ